MMMLSRNKPVAYIAGVAGFLGSHLAEKLLTKNIQVVGVDNFSTGKKEYLAEASKDKNFHLLNQSISDDFTFELPSLDYAFFIIPEDLDNREYEKSLANFINLCKGFGPKIVYVSSLDLYDQHLPTPNLKKGESTFAQMSLKNHLNCRIVRLSAVYGPRMHFRPDDPMLRLIYAAAKGEVQKETTALDFTTRSIYIDQAVDLLIKAVMHGSTAQKIYDGALLFPLKVMEVKQILLDPVWYESRGFLPTQLPPWPTPNIVKTQKELAWQSQVQLISSLKQTLHFFQQFPQYLPQAESFKVEKSETSEKGSEGEYAPLAEEKKEQLKELFGPKTGELTKNKPKGGEWLKRGQHYLLVVLLLALISYATVYPLSLVAIATLNIQAKLSQSYRSSQAGDYAQAQKEAAAALLAVGELKKNVHSLKLLASLGLLENFLQSINQLTGVVEKSVVGLQSEAMGKAALGESLKIIFGEKEGNSQKMFLEAQLNFDQAQQNLGLVQGKLSDPVFLSLAVVPLPVIDSYLQGNLKRLGERVAEVEKSLQQERLAAAILPGLMPSSGKKSYLVLLEDSFIPQSRGRAILSYGQITFEEGKLKEIKVEEGSKLSPEMAVVLNQGMDFSTRARDAAWLYQQRQGQVVSGVIALDEQALSAISQTLGGLSVTGSSLESGASPLMKEFLNKLFFSSISNYGKIGTALLKQLGEKHLVVYTSDPQTYSYLQTWGWTGHFPKQIKEKIGEREEFLALFETGSDVGEIPPKELNLEMVVDKNKEVNHRLEVNYTTQGDSGSQFKLKTYLRGGSKLLSAKWGEEDLIKSSEAFADFGRAGFGFNLKIEANSQKKLILQYQDSNPLEFADGKLKFSLEVIKQLGGGEEPLNFQLKLPEDIKIVAGKGDQSLNLKTDQSLNLTLEQIP